MLLVIKNYAKDIHYSVNGDHFYGDHLFADRIAEPIDGFVDAIKETCLLGNLPNGIRPLVSTQYLDTALALFPTFNMNDTNSNWLALQTLIEETLQHIANLEDNVKSNRGAAAVLDSIAEHLQNMNGLLGLRNLPFV